MCLAGPALSTAGTATVSWNPNMESDLSGYKIYYGTASATYTQVQNVALTSTPSTPSLTLNSLTDGETYFFAVTAYDLNGNESTFSGEVWKVIGTGTTGGGSSGGGSSGGGSSGGGSSGGGSSGGGGCGTLKNISSEGGSSLGAMSGQLLINLSALVLVVSLGKLNCLVRRFRYCSPWLHRYTLA